MVFEKKYGSWFIKWHFSGYEPLVNTTSRMMQYDALGAVSK